jgi:3-methylcrotonyl-CoA carboxylase alpha subunit
MRRLLIANRGEIACRIMRTAWRLGIETVAVYAQGEERAPHVLMADRAYYLGGQEGALPYLNISKLLTIAANSGADAIHPGYGFLSENADFAAAVEAGGYKFVGPSAAAMRLLGDKGAAKQTMALAGVPLLPGYVGAAQDDSTMMAAAAALGVPLIIKAAAGGGGKGMRVVRMLDEFLPALHAAKREAKQAFGDERVILERYLSCPRHIEIQLFADNYGNAVSLYERDCSLQRRHQKVWEEAPAPNLTPALREELGRIACAGAIAARYCGAGTMEFLLAEDGAYYFMEMNTRLQVEHPVTEMITGLDLVEWQLRIASGAPLPLEQAAIPLNGHAIEVRLYAEDPARGFLPSAGTVGALHWPTQSGGGIRIETALLQQDKVGGQFDPMLAKIIVSASDRQTAMAKLAKALAELAVAGLVTNRDLLLALARRPSEMIADTSWLEAATPSLLTATREQERTARALAVIGLACLAGLRATDMATQDPWHNDAWRLNAPAQLKFYLKEMGKFYLKEIGSNPQYHELYLEQVKTLKTRDDDSSGLCCEEVSWQVKNQDDTIAVGKWHYSEGKLTAQLSDQQHQALIYLEEKVLWLIDSEKTWRWQLASPPLVRPNMAPASLSTPVHSLQEIVTVSAPMFGRLISLAIQPGERVRVGQSLAIIEAMKMEHPIHAPIDGQVIAIFAAEGAQLQEAMALITIQPEGSLALGTTTG